MRPLILDYKTKREPAAENLTIPYSYNQEKGLNVVIQDGATIPLIELSSDDLTERTATRVMGEQDDHHIFPSAQTTTKVGGEGRDRNFDMLSLLTKTFAQVESDDVRPSNYE